MKNEKESEEKIQKSSSSTSEVLEISVDLTSKPTTSREPHIITLKTSKPAGLPQISKNESIKSKKLPKIHHIVLEVLDSVLDSATRQLPTTSGLQFLEGPREVHHHMSTSQPNIVISPKPEVKLLSNSGGGLINSTSAMHNENYLKKTKSGISLKRVPPSYSTVLKLGAPLGPLPQYDSRTYSGGVIVRQPPPSYAEVHGGWNDTPSVVSSDSFILGPNPIYVSCPRCRTIVISETHSERSHLTYISSVVLCICGCWPCCFLPFCVKSCRNTYHFCPACNYYLGVYRPC